MADPYIAICAKCKWAKLVLGEDRRDESSWLCMKHEHPTAINCITGEVEIQVMVPARLVALRQQFGPMADMMRISEGMEEILPTGYRIVTAKPGYTHEFCKNINPKGNCPDFEEVPSGNPD